MTHDDHCQVVSVTGHLPHHHHLAQCEPGPPPAQAGPTPAELPAHTHGHPLLPDQGQGESLAPILIKWWRMIISWVIFQLLRQEKITYSDSSSAWDDSSQMTSTSCSPSPSSSFSQESLSSDVVKSSSNKIGKCIVTNLWQSHFKYITSSQH